VEEDTSPESNVAAGEDISPDFARWVTEASEVGALRLRLPDPTPIFRHGSLEYFGAGFPRSFSALDLPKTDPHRLLLDSLKSTDQEAIDRRKLFHSANSFLIQHSWPEFEVDFAEDRTLGLLGGSGESMAQSWPKNSTIASSSSTTEEPEPDLARADDFTLASLVGGRAPSPF
jgi:hypothetical protein